MRAVRFGIVICGMWLTCVAACSGQELKLEKGDHICIVGNTLAERMQHYGWVETLLHARFPEHDLVIRNMGYSGDEIDGFRNAQSRMRSMSFGTHDEWLSASSPVPQPTKLSSRDQGKVSENRFALTETKADVILAFYGYGESWAGDAGLDKFRENATAFVTHTKGQKYNGKSAPRLVLCSPIAFEFTGDPNLPDQAECDARNANLRKYTAVLKEVAEKEQVTFVDLFTPTLKKDAGKDRHTINGVHITAAGEKAVAEALDRALFGPPPAKAGPKEAIRTAVLDKNFYWYNRYRVTDGYSTYGDRAFLKFAEGPGGYGDGLSNYSVGQRELEALDVLTSNRDKVIHAAARGQTIKPVDNNLAEFLQVISNKPGPLPGGKHQFLGGAEAIGKMTVHKNMKVNLFADETMFPELINPVQMSFDMKGRLWVACWITYPHWQPTTPMNDSLLILEDTDKDGKADVCKTFAGDIHNPTGFEFWNGGVLVAQGPDLLFLKDTNGDDKYDVKERILHGVDTADTHHAINSFTFDPGGAIYMQEGTFHQSQVESPWGPTQRVSNGAVHRYEPRAQKHDIYVSYGFANPHGHVFDRWGQDIVVDGTGSNPYHAALFSGHVDFPRKHSGTPGVYKQRTRPCPGIEVLSSKHFPEEFEGNLLVGNVIGFQGILQYKVHDDGASFGATEVEPIVFSSDPNFRPSDLEMAPDGTLYFTDWQNPIIGHMQHNLRDPARDKIHGRVYRVTYEGRDPAPAMPVAGAKTEDLFKALEEGDNRTAYRARIELGSRPAKETAAAAQKWLTAIDSKNAGYERRRLETLWLHQNLNVVDPALLEATLESKDFRARSAAVRVLCYWRDRVSNTLPLLLKLAADEHPRVRLEAVRAASFLPEAEAAEVVLVSQEMPSDPFLVHIQKETMGTLQPYLDKAKAENRRVAFSTEAGARYFLKNVSTEQLLKEEKTRLVYLEMLTRPGLQDDVRREATAGLARLSSKPELTVIMDAIRSLDAREGGTDSSVVFDLVRQLTSRPAAELGAARTELEKLATSAKQPVFRQIGFVSLINVDGSVEPAWKLAVGSSSSLLDFVRAMPLISDAAVRSSLYERVESLLEKLPAPLAEEAAKGTKGRYVRIELPGNGTLTLAEVEVYSDGTNVARKGRAIQKNTSHGGDAMKAIDGNKSASYGDNGQTHTEENTRNPYWEVDLGAELPIDAVVVFNRADGLGKRLDGFTLKVLDGERNEVFKREKNPAPEVSSKLDLPAGGKGDAVRDAAMLALTNVRGQETKTYGTLSRFVHKGGSGRIAAVRAMQRIPKADWSKETAGSLLGVVLEAVEAIPAKDRTGDTALDLLEFGDALASLLPPENAKGMRARLGELGVRVIRIGTVFEKMSFDKELIVIQAGKPVEFVLDNTDLMPHNFVITQPGALEEIGTAAEAQAQQPAFAARHFVPDSKKVLAASKLLQPRESQKVSFNAPKQAGVYPFVCTYPGHWRRMYGALYVVDDLDAYQGNPDAYLTAHPLSAVDPLLKDRRPRTEWTLEDLTAALVDLDHGRSHSTGKELFKVTSCSGCHKLEGVGNEFGPNLAELDPKYKPVDVLKSLLDPSEKIHEKYQTFVFELGNGTVVSGLIVGETPDAVKVIENPLIKAVPVELKKGDIIERAKSNKSTMPKGLLDKLTRDEILDLLAYVIAKGKKDHSYFKAGGHDHGHKH